MRRYALLIEVSEAKGQAKITGCVRDVERMETWLGGVAGGAWNPNEIKILHNPTPTEITHAKRMADIADFAFIAFSGHGRIVEDRSGKRSQMVTAGNGEEIDFQTLKPVAEKSIMLCDACREVHRRAEQPFSTKSFELFEKRAAPRFTRHDFRYAFDQAVENSQTGQYTMYSCSPGQCAGEDPLNGGVFTDALLNRSSEWFERTYSSGILTIPNAFEATKRSVSAEFPDQIPMGGPSNRSGNSFPFSICLK